MPDSPSNTSHTMACMEVWGGNRAINTGVVMPGLDAWLYCRPYQRAGATDAGGDIHYITSCASGRIARMIIADVSGHGAPVARAADALRRLMRRHSNQIEQTRLLESMNREFGQIHDGDEGSGGGGTFLFATAVAATYFSPTDELSIACAGHPRPIHVQRRGSSAKGELIDPPPSDPADRGSPADLPLGVLESTSYGVSTIILKPDDIVVLYTDSLIEAQSPTGQQLGQAGLADLLAGIAPCPPEQFANETLRAVSAWAGKSIDDPLAFDDDLTILVMRRNAAKPTPSFMLGALATWRIVREALRSVLPNALPATFPELSVRAIIGAVSQAKNTPAPPRSARGLAKR